MWTKTVVEWLERIADQSKRLENDPACGCMPEPKVGSNGLVNLMLDRISMLVPFERGRGHIDFPTLGLSVRAKDIQQLFRKTIRFPEDMFPAIYYSWRTLTQPFFRDGSGPMFRNDWR